MNIVGPSRLPDYEVAQIAERAAWDQLPLHRQLITPAPESYQGEAYLVRGIAALVGGIRRLCPDLSSRRDPLEDLG